MNRPGFNGGSVGECVRFAATKDYGTAPDGTKYGDWFYVDAETNYPVELRRTRGGGKIVDIRFQVYELLPANEANLALLDLSEQYPGATTVEDVPKAQDQPGDPSDGQTGDTTVSKQK